MKKRYVVSIEIIMEDDNNDNKKFDGLNLGMLNVAQNAGVIESWDFVDVESVHNVKKDGTVDYGE